MVKTHGRGSGGYRLVWFHHLHKSAGTLIANMALRHGEVPCASHENGNPNGEDGVLLPIWEYDEGTLGSFIDECEREGVTFVATKHGASDSGSTWVIPPRSRRSCCGTSSGLEPGFAVAGGGRGPWS